MIEERLAALNISLPNPPKPAGSYLPVVRTGNLVFVSGQIPEKEGKVQFERKALVNITIEQAQNAAKICVVNALAQLKAELGTLDQISRIVKVSGFVNSSQDCTEQPRVINAASDFLFEIFGEKGKHSRIAVGVASLPLNSAVEIDLIAEVI